MNLSASPYHVGKAEEREEMLVARARDTSSFFAFCNLVGGQDELVFDGHSVVLDDSGEVIARAPGLRGAPARRATSSRSSRSDGGCGTPGGASSTGRASRCRRSRSSSFLPPPRTRTSISGAIAPFEPELEQMRRALTLGLRDYVEKNGFRDVVVGVSGGIDSAVTAALCADALGPARVHCVSHAVALQLGGHEDGRARARGEPRLRLPRDPDRGRRSRRSTRPCGSRVGELEGLAAENLQARVRGVILMALSNTYGWLVVSTGNKSELAVGYSTLYGDMVGGFSLLKDVFKTDVFRLAGHLNERAGRELVPRTTIERAPSAELRPDQRDEDSIPPYDALDPVLEAYVELDRSREELLEEFDREVVERAVALVDRAEYKRRQAPPGVKLRPKAFGRDRRTPITNRWRD